jgi:hypothetical protein
MELVTITLDVNETFAWSGIFVETNILIVSTTTSLSFFVAIAI